jgi:hypothetical protein
VPLKYFLIIVSIEFNIYFDISEGCVKKQKFIKMRAEFYIYYIYIKKVALLINSSIFNSCKRKRKETQHKKKRGIIKKRLLNNNNNDDDDEDDDDVKTAKYII